MRLTGYGWLRQDTRVLGMQTRIAPQVRPHVRGDGAREIPPAAGTRTARGIVGRQPGRIHP